jgi:thiamine-phosphate pyrophosphorylase
LIQAVQGAVRGGAQIIQIWHAEKTHDKDVTYISKEINAIANQAHVPLIVHNDLDLAKRIGASGVHFDDFETPANAAREILGIDAIVGYTCGNNQEIVLRAKSLDSDYISFCAVFPSTSVQSCEIVPLDSLRRAKQLVSIPVFASGGITLANAHLVLEAGADGLAIASSILRSSEPEATARAFRKIIDKHSA